jgi:hypothetical protein
MSSTLPIKEIKEKVAKKPFYIDLNSKIEYDLANTDIYRKEIETDIIYFSLREQLFTSFIRAFNKTKAKGSKVNAKKMYKIFSSRLLESIPNEIDTSGFLSKLRLAIESSKSLDLNKGTRTLTVIKSITGKEGTTYYKVRGATDDTFIGILILSTNVKGGGYQAFSSFLRKKIVASTDKELPIADRRIIPKELRITDSTGATRRGFDFAHVLMGELSQSAGTNTPVSRFLDEIRFAAKDDIDAQNDIKNATQSLQNFHNAQYRSILEDPKSKSKIVKDANIEIEYNFLKDFSGTDITGSIGISILIPEYATDNSKLGTLEKSTIEAGVKKAVITSIEKDSKLIDKFLTVRTSPSITDKVEQSLVETILTGKRPKGWRSKSKTYTDSIPVQVSSKKTKKQNVPKPKKLTGVVKNTLSMPVTKTAPMRNAYGQFTSLSKILTMLQGNIREQVRSNMKTPRLIYRSGRFADSVKISNITRSDKGLYTISYGYATYPYQTFEPGYKQGSIKRDPRSLIRLSIRELVAKEIGDNFKAVRLGGIGSRGKIE